MLDIDGMLNILCCCVLVNGDVRLINRYYGLLEFYHNQWGYVCDHGWRIQAANVACRRLGYRRALKSYISRRGPHWNDFFTLDDVECSGGEVSLLDCAVNYQENCNNYNHVYLECERGKSAVFGTSFFNTTRLAFCYECACAFHSICFISLYRWVRSFPLQS